MDARQGKVEQIHGMIGGDGEYSYAANSSGQVSFHPCFNFIWILFWSLQSESWYCSKYIDLYVRVLRLEKDNYYDKLHIGERHRANVQDAASGANYHRRPRLFFRPKHSFSGLSSS